MVVVKEGLKGSIWLSLIENWFHIGGLDPLNKATFEIFLDPGMLKFGLWMG
jgi:hypothetical protein